ncbi:flagellar biosynthesis protein FlhA [Roseovarius sp. 217]|uniref:flagellar biosynthesis protein FlhA n=1 Tax=Roseovarius sp. (strain 217) TaxID=314264 RepID=UPI0000685556|nr:flagellar biosynthesis protein FlhA [Roseovarius sp. 217]EAQ24857.1 putative type III secretion pore protein [Roseovarius sp. 217]
MRKDLALVALLISILALMVIPLPTGLIDALLVISISLSVVLLMVAVYLKRPSDFSTFPSVILIATAFRLALSIATTRLILSEADAGQIIATFGEFVVRGSVVIGLVMFLIITVVQFVVVTKGAERVAEVAARFTLDAMPGKQMSIEADIRAGTLPQDEGALQRKALDKDSQFFGAMDGAMKFVKGDATAGLIIIFINLVGGIAVGTGVHGLSLGEAASVYSLLTIGDGLVAQIPALLMSICAGVIVTRVANEKPQDLGTDIAKELMSDARVPAAAAIVLLLFGFVPGFPFMVFAAAAVILFVASTLIKATG